MRHPSASGRTVSRIVALATAVVVAVAVAGCGGADPGTKHALLNVTTDFGAHTVGTAVEKQIDGSQTELQLLGRHFTVTTGPRQDQILSINGVRSNNAHVKWMLYINGLLDGKLPKNTSVHQGDHVWWDLQNWLIAQPKAIVGSYPEPFTNGNGGREAPTLLECGPVDQNACDLVGETLHKAGVKAGDSEIGGENGPNSNTVIVGNWKELKPLIVSELIQAGPFHSGVFAQFTGDNGLALLNPIGGVAKTLHGSIGLIAAVQNGTQTAPAWLVTGTDSAAVMAAARHLNSASLHDKFAVAIQNGKVISLPVVTQ